MVSISVSNSPATPGDWLRVGSALSVVSAVAVAGLALAGRVSFVTPFCTAVISAIVLDILRQICNDQEVGFSFAFSLGRSCRYFSEGSTFEIDEKKYYIALTQGGGACGIHAFLGTKESPSSSYALNVPNVREHYTNALKSHLKEDIIRKKWEEWMVNFIQDYLCSNGRYTSMVFNELDLSKLKKNLKELDEEKARLKDHQGILLKEALDDETCGAIIRKKVDESILAEGRYISGDKEKKAHTDKLKDRLQKEPNFIYDRMRSGLDDIIDSLKDQSIGQQINTNLTQLKKVENSREKAYLDCIQQQDVENAYIKGVSNSSYYFATQELGLMAYLFQKRIHVYHEINGEPSLELDEGEGGQDPVVVFHAGAHFSRCEIQNNL